MEKGDLIKIFVIAIVLLFLLEFFAFRNSYPFRPQREENETQITSGALGTSLVNATLLSYPDGVIISMGKGITNDDEFLDYIKELRRNTTLSYYTIGPGSVNMILTNGANLTSLGREMVVRFSNYTFLSRAIFLIPENTTLYSHEGNVEVGERRVSVRIEPVLDEGDNTTLLISGMVKEGNIVGDLDVKLAEVEMETIIPEEILHLEDRWVVQGYYEWEHRKVNASAIERGIKSRYSNSFLDYQSVPFIIAESINASQKDMIGNLDYVIAVYNNTIIVDYDFRDRERAEKDLRKILGNQSITFPRSYINLEINASEVNAGFILSTFGADELSVVRVGTVRIGPHIDIGGRKFILPGEITVVDKLPSNATVGDIIHRESRVVVKGGMVIRIL